MKYDVNFFIDKFERIPESEFCTHNFKNPFNQRCFLGHTLPDSAIKQALRSMNEFGEVYKPTPIELETTFSECYSLCLLLAPDKPRTGSGIAIDINNGDDERYQQPTPKQRILAALYDIKKAQDDHMVVSEVKERIVYVTVDKEVRELQKTELSLQ